MNINFIYLFNNTGATATHIFYYQYLKKFKTCFTDYFNKSEKNIYREVEENIKDMDELEFIQI